MKRIPPVLIALVAVLAVLPSASGAGDASTLRHFTKVYTCGIEDSDDPSGLIVDFGAGYYTDSHGQVANPCGYNTVHWHPTVGPFTATVRWYAGTRVVSKKVFHVRNTRTATESSLYRYGLRQRGTTRLWTLNGKPVKATITLTRTGYASLTVTRTHFKPVY